LAYRLRWDFLRVETDEFSRRAQSNWMRSMTSGTWPLIHAERAALAVCTLSST
jgi:hypothetical protein